MDSFYHLVGFLVFWYMIGFGIGYLGWPRYYAWKDRRDSRKYSDEHATPVRVQDSERP